MREIFIKMETEVPKEYPRQIVDFFDNQMDMLFAIEPFIQYEEQEKIVLVYIEDKGWTIYSRGIDHEEVDRQQAERKHNLFNRAFEEIICGDFSTTKRIITLSPKDEV